MWKPATRTGIARWVLSSVLATPSVSPISAKPLTPTPPPNRIAAAAATPTESLPLHSQRITSTVNHRSAVALLGAQPFSFEANHGQTHQRVKFLTRGADYSLFLTGEEAVFVLRGKGAESPSTLHLKLRDSNPVAAIEPVERQKGYVNYYIGKDSTRWQTQVPRFAKVRYKSVYPGIDLVYYGSQNQLEYDFIVAPGADPKSIEMNFTADSSDLSLELTDDGDLLVETAGKTLRQKKPLAYQEINGTRRTIDARYVLTSASGNHRAVTLQVGAYDRAVPLVIDPVIIYSTYLGGGSDPAGQLQAESIPASVASDANGALYITGWTNALDFPGAPALPPGTGTHAFVSKLTPAGNGVSDLVWTTILADSRVNAIVVGSAGVHIAGVAGGNFPTTPGGFQTTGAGAFVSRLDGNGQLTYSTYLSGTSSAEAKAVALDFSGNVIVAGVTIFGGFPTTANAVQTTSFNTAENDAFVSVLNLAGQNGNDLLYSTLLSGGRSCARQYRR